jgi:hypothetical protein
VFSGIIRFSYYGRRWLVSEATNYVFMSLLFIFLPLQMSTRSDVTTGPIRLKLGCNLGNTVS